MNRARDMLRMVLAGMLLLVRGAAAEAPQAPAAVPEFRDAGRVVASRESQFDFTSKINGLTYRVMISAPQDMQPGKSYPVIYVLDGNWYFRSMSDTVTWGSGKYPPAIVVGVGYATELNADVSRLRKFDLSLSPASRGMPEGKYGGGDDFIRVIEEEVKPFVAARLPVDPKRQILYGKSFGGLLALRVLFRHSETFSTYIVASPSIWWNDQQILKDEPAFVSRVKSGGLNLRVLVTSASEEQYRGSDPALREKDLARMIDSASELVDRLKALEPHGLSISWTLIPDESHNSVSLATIGRAVPFALPVASSQ